MESLKATVQSKTAVPTAQVYVSHILCIHFLLAYVHVYAHPLVYIQPLFMSLSQHWTGYQDEVVLLSVQSSLLFQLAQFTQTSASLAEGDTVAALLEQTIAPTDVERMKVCIYTVKLLLLA